MRYFVAVAEWENVTRAASQLHVSQPALSRQIRDLEAELGFPLLERSAKSIHLTAAGRIFLEEAKAVIERAAMAVRTARVAAAGASETLHVGYAPTLTARILPGALSAFQRVMPRVRVKLHDLGSEEILAGIRSSKVDLGITVRPAKSSLSGLNFVEIQRQPLRLAVARTHRWARRSSVSMVEAGREPFVAYSQKEYPDYHDLLASLFTRQKQKLKVVEEHDGVSSLISALEASTGVAIVPEAISCMAGIRLKLLSLVPEPAPLIVGVVRANQLLSLTGDAFLQALHEAASERSQSG